MTLDEVGDCPEYKENLDRLRTRFAEAKLEIENVRLQILLWLSEPLHG